MADHVKMKEAVHSYLNAFSTGDVEKAVSLYAADGSVEDPIGSPVQKGTAAVRTFYTYAMQNANVQLHLEGAISLAENHAAFPFSVRFSDAGDAQQIDVIDVFRFNDAGEIAEMRAFFTPTEHTQSGPGHSADAARKQQSDAAHYGRMHDAVRAYAAAWASGDLGGLVRLYAKDGVIADPVGTPPAIGTDGIRALFERGIGMDTRITINGPVRTVGRHAAFPLSVFTTFDDRKIRIDAIDLFRFDENLKIVDHRAFWGADNQHEV